jgi:hypothetical protein
MIDENRYEWEVYYNGVLLGRTNTEGRHQLVKEKVEHPVGIPEIEFKLVLKQSGVEDAFRRDCVDSIKHKFGVEE